MKPSTPILIIACAISWAIAFAQDKTSPPQSTKWEGGRVPAILYQRDFELHASRLFYNLELPRGDIQAVAKRLHPIIVSQREQIAAKLIQKFKGDTHGSFMIHWVSDVVVDDTPEKVKNMGEDKVSQLGDARMLTFGTFVAPSNVATNTNGDKPSGARLDLWVREKNVWFVIPNEVINMKEVLRASKDLKDLVN